VNGVPSTIDGEIGRTRGRLLIIAVRAACCRRALRRTEAAQVSSPLLTVAVPAYNCAELLGRALAALCVSDARVEVVVVDDGSTDATGILAESCAHTYPDRIRVVHQVNGGHGAAIDTGIAHARGRYVKVLDADDWLSSTALARVLDVLERLEEAGGVDALFTDFVHDRVDKPARVTRFGTVFPAERVFGWEDTQRFGRRQYLMMHAVIYRTALLREVELNLPRHTFYVDSLVRPASARARTSHVLPARCAVPLLHRPVWPVGRAGGHAGPRRPAAAREPPRAGDPAEHRGRAGRERPGTALRRATALRPRAVRHRERDARTGRYAPRTWRCAVPSGARSSATVPASTLICAGVSSGQAAICRALAGRHVTRAAYHLARRYVGFS